MFDEELRIDTDLKTMQESASLSPIMRSNIDHQMIPKEGAISRGSKLDEKQLLRMVEEIDDKVQDIKSMSTLTGKEEAEVEKTLTILRSQLNPKKKRKKEPFKKFNFSFFKGPSQPNTVDHSSSSKASKCD